MAGLYPGRVELKIYQVGRDFEYLRKYGNITRGTMIVNQRMKTERLDRSYVEKLICQAVEEAKSNK